MSKLNTSTALPPMGMMIMYCFMRFFCYCSQPFLLGKNISFKSSGRFIPLPATSWISSSLMVSPGSKNLYP